MLTLSGHLGLMQHGLGKTPDSRHRLLDTFNAAGRALVTAHTWTWRIRGPVQLTTTAGQGWVELPEDFGQLATVYIPSAGAIQKVELTGLQNLGQIRALATSYIGTGLIYAYFPSWSPPPNREGVQRQRVELAPIPGATGAPVFQIYYYNTWREMDQEADGDAFPSVPIEFEHALKLMARAFAVNIENQEAALEDTAVANELGRLRLEDNRRQTTFGRMTGGADARMSTNIATRRVVGMAQL